VTEEVVQMAFEDIQVEAGGEVLISAPISVVFKFISDPETRVDPVTPLDARRMTKDDPSQDSLGECELKIAGRILHYEIISKVFEPPTRLVAEMQGDVTGEQRFTLAEEAGSTRLQLDLEYVVPPDWPSYYRDEPTRTLFAETLVAQTLANIKAALEMD
jgi:carbon monoxide dehydrogenase subunit G